MWSKTGQCRPQDYSLHYTYNNISERPTEEEKINYIDNLLNTILERSHSKGNFSDLRAELVDHYVSELGEAFHIESGSQFHLKLHEYHGTFGGHERVMNIAKNFYKNKQRLVKWQFLKWFTSHWMVHMAMAPVLVSLLYFTSPFVTIMATLVIVVSIGIFEGVKIYLNRDIIKQSRTGDSSVNFFYQYKNELSTGILAPIYFYQLSPDGMSSVDLIFQGLAILFIYIQIWIYYYHLNICQRRIAPLLNQYKSQLI